jgi:Icc-related predicted phosphoesterase
MADLSCLFASDLHGREDHYRRLFAHVTEARPTAVFLGGDLLPSGSLRFGNSCHGQGDFLEGFLLPRLRELRQTLKKTYPSVFLILGNDDPRSQETEFLKHADEGLWHYCHMRKVRLGPHMIYGYSCVPPTPFLLKDWERYDVSRFVDPGAVPPEEGRYSVALPDEKKGFPTIQEDLARLAGDDPLDQAIFLFHSPPYQTKLDRAALDGRMVDSAPLDVHVGSIAIRRFIEERQLTGSWRDAIGRTHCFSGAHNGRELAVVCFDPSEPAAAARRLL